MPSAAPLAEGPCRWEAVCPLHETWSDGHGRAARGARDDHAGRGRSSRPFDRDGDLPDPGRLAPHGSGCRRGRGRRPRRAGGDRGAHPALAFGAPARPSRRRGRSEATRSERRTAGLRVQRDERALVVGQSRTGPTGPAARSPCFLPHRRCRTSSARYVLSWKLSAQGWPLCPRCRPEDCRCRRRALRAAPRRHLEAGPCNVACRAEGPPSSTNWPVARCAPSFAGWLGCSSRRRRSPSAHDTALAGRRR